MATTVTKGAYYTFDTANFTWDAQQAIHTWDDMAPLIYTRDDAETFGLRDGRTSTAGKVAIDVVRLADTRIWSDMLGVKNEHVGVHETYWDYISYILRIIESARVIESSYRAMDTPKREGIKIVRASHSEIMESAREQLGILDTSLRAAFAKLARESTEVEDARDAAVTHMSFDEVVAGDGLTISLGKMMAEQLGILDTSLRAAAFRRTWDESAQLDDNEDNHVTAGKFEKVQTTDSRSADIYQPKEEVVGVADRQTHRARTLRTFDEKANVWEHMRRDLGGGYSETVAVDDRFLRALNGIIEEITLKKGGMTAADFQQLVNQPTGYERFIPYIVGEYEYQKALVRLAVTPGSLGAEPAVYNVVVHVDIDDTVDRGTTIITDTSAATTVHFSKHYYTRPEVTVTLRGGSTADGIITPNVTEIDKDEDGYYFKVELLKSDGTRAKGTITWQSVGY